MKTTHFAELTYGGYDPAFEELVGFWGAFYKLKVTYCAPLHNLSIIHIRMKGHRGVFTKKINALEKRLRLIKNKKKNFNVWKNK